MTYLPPYGRTFRLLPIWGCYKQRCWSYLHFNSARSGKGWALWAKGRLWPPLCPRRGAGAGWKLRSWQPGRSPTTHPRPLQAPSPRAWLSVSAGLHFLEMSWVMRVKLRPKALERLGGNAPRAEERRVGGKQETHRLGWYPGGGAAARGRTPAA